MNWYELGMKNLVRRRKKTMILFTAIVAAVFIVTAFISAYQGMMAAVEDGASKYGTSFRLEPVNNRVAITYQGIPIISNSSSQDPPLLSYEDFQLIKEKQTEAIGLSPRAVTSGVIKELQADVIVVGIDINEERAMKPWWKIWGKWPEQKEEIIIGYEVGNLLNLRQGDLITLASKEGEVTYKVAGMLHHTGHIDDRLLFIVYDQAPIHFLEMIVPFGHNLSVAAPAGWQWQEQKGSLNETHFLAVKKISQFSPYIILVTSVLGLLIVFITLIYELGERRGEFTLLQAIGLTKSLIVQIVLFEIVVLSVVGSLVGIILGVVSANMWNGLMSGLQFFAYIKASQVVSLIVTITVITLLLSLIPVLKALRKEPYSLLRQE